MKQQQGVALVSTILLLLILTLVAVALAGRSRLSLQMSSAGIAREESIQQVNGEQDRFIDSQRQALGSSQFVVAPVELNADINQVSFISESGCRRSRKATSNGVVGCRQNEVETTVNFGRNNRGSVAIVSGVEQPVLLVSGG